jgi:hypothetical protein
MEQLYELSRPFPESLVKTKPGKFTAAFVEHSVIVQRLLEVLGPYTFTVDTPVANPDGVIVGCLATLEVMVDGDFVTVTEVGDCEHPGASNAQNLQMAASSAFKRCAMRLGCGLHLWAGDGSYYLDKALAKRMPKGDGDE